MEWNDRYLYRNYVSICLIMHDSIIIEVNGKKRQIDKELVPLILELNHLGLKTTNSCQGSLHNNAYLSIQLDEKSHFDYYPEKNVLTIRWDRSGKDHLPVESNIITKTGINRFSEILPILEREHGARFGNLQKIERGN